MKTLQWTCTRTYRVESRGSRHERERGWDFLSEKKQDPYSHGLRLVGRPPSQSPSPGTPSSELYLKSFLKTSMSMGLTLNPFLWSLYLFVPGNRNVWESSKPPYTYLPGKFYKSLCPGSVPDQILTRTLSRVWGRLLPRSYI